jgi:hypothetical protein
LPDPKNSGKKEKETTSPRTTRAPQLKIQVKRPGQEEKKEDSE